MSGDVTQLLQRANAGDAQARDEMITVVYRELHRLASRVMHGENAGHTLQATALVSETYLKLFGGQGVKPNDSQHFFALAAQQMRRILVDHARAKHADKRGGIKISLDEMYQISSEPDGDLVLVDEALKELQELDPEAAQVVELKFFGGYTDQETANIVGVNVAKVRRDWEFARAWLHHHLEAS
ncbi:MAG: sigma-70 family RNA polymerase sigma factor [Acidobacteria bacterium]|nr:sigma-70 family RNA polymerase sigma factor [Acidobacteriota bacterium]